MLNTAGALSAGSNTASKLPSLVDFHAHILPGTDHGSPGLDHSIRQLRCAGAAGIKTIVATPHYYISEGISIPDFIEKRSAAADLLTRNSDDGIVIIPAAEVHLTYETGELEHLPLLCVGSTDYILIEMPYGAWDGWVFDALLAISSVRHLKLIIAHVDRYDTKDLLKLIPFGFTLQVNSESVCRRSVRKRLMPYIKSSDISLLGSDVHDMPEYSYSRYTRAIKLLGDSTAAMMEKASFILEGK
ncbi:MAG: CpsB/CapC family capsule biosynthesis tyrosine phosphatase [Eubacteriales bacterium]